MISQSREVWQHWDKVSQQILRMIAPYVKYAVKWLDRALLMEDDL